MGLVQKVVTNKAAQKVSERLTKSSQKGLTQAGPWLGVWVGLQGWKILKKRAERKPTIVREVILPGEKLLITHFQQGQEDAPPA